MKLNKKYWLSALMIPLALTLSSCDSDPGGGTGGGDDDDDPKIEFMKQSAHGFYSGDDEIRVFNELQDQVVTHSSGLIYRLQNDSQSDYWHVVFSSANLSMGATQDIELTSSSSSHSGTYSVEVVKTGTNVWLWDDAEEFGIIVPGDF